MRLAVSANILSWEWTGSVPKLESLRKITKSLIANAKRHRKETEELNLQKSKDDIAMKGAKCKWEAKKGDLKRKWEKKKGDLKRKWERAKDNMRLKWAMKTRENKTRPYVPLNDNIKRDGGRRSSNIPLRDNIEPRRDMRHTHVPSREEANATAIAAIATFTLFGMLLMS